MDKLQPQKFLLLSRSYAIATENICMRPVMTSVMNKGKDLVEKKVKEEENFWMKDPKTGNWIPESHFGEIDAADMRKKFLARKGKF